MSVIIPIRNEIAHIDVTLREALGQEYDGELEFLLVDGDSEDGTTEVLREAVRQDARCRLLHNPARRTPQALNVGLRAARGRYVVRMDAHTHFPRDYVARAVERLARGDVTWVTGPALPLGHGDWSKRVSLALSTWLGVGGATFRKRLDHEVEVNTGFAGIMERETLEHLGGWNEGWPFDEDTELAARVRGDGGKIVCIPAMASEYIPRDSLPALARQYWRYGRYRVKTAVRHPNSLRSTHLLPPGLALTLLLALGAPEHRVVRIARTGLGVYTLALIGTSSRYLPTRPVDAALLPAVFASMHLPFGFGMLAGILEHGIPTAAVTHALRPHPDKEI